MTQRRRNYTEEFKREALTLWASSEKTGKQLEEELGIGAGCLYRWRAEKRAAEEEAATLTTGERELQLAQQRIQELEAEVALLKQEREILKKAVTIFSRPKANASSS